ncbi:MAG: NUDIX hydrolase [Acidimicrobiales bacterium]
MSDDVLGTMDAGVDVQVYALEAQRIGAPVSRENGAASPQQARCLSGRLSYRLGSSSAVIYAERGDDILLVKRAGGALSGRWFLPCGLVERGELPEEGGQARAARGERARPPGGARARPGLPDMGLRRRLPAVVVSRSRDGRRRRHQCGARRGPLDRPSCSGRASPTN